MQAKQIMNRDVFTVNESDSVQRVVEVFVREHIHGAPVLGSDGSLVGVVTQQDIFFSSMTTGASDGEEPPAGQAVAGLRVREIMTTPAVSANEETELRDLCALMTRLRIHRVPIVKGGAVTGIVSSLDVCRAVAEGALG